ncbi:MAG: efflux RND transporter periplasmic adaptor subunit [Methylophagaceae bacterium]
MNIARAEVNLPVIAVMEKTFPQNEVFDAVVEAVHHSTVSSRIAAEVIELNYDVDDVVPKGAVIMKFRDDELQARISQVKATLLANKAQYNAAIARQKEVSADTKRVKDLFKRKLLAQAALDKANANMSTANAKVQAVQAQLKARQAQLDEAKVQLSYTEIIAPYSGVVMERFIELGEMAIPGQPLMTGISLDHLRVIVNIPQYLLDGIKSAENPLFILADGRQIIGEKITILPHADPQSHSFKVRVDLMADSERIYAGTFGKLHFKVGNEQIIVIPQQVVVQRSEVAGVYVLTTDQHIIFRQIRLGRLLQGEQREILAGLSVGEQVAKDPLQAVRLLKQNSSRSDP